MSSSCILWCLSAVLSLVLCPLLSGIINKVKAFFAGRRGPSIFQLYYDIRKLLRKGSVYSSTATHVLRSVRWRRCSDAFFFCRSA